MGVSRARVVGLSSVSHWDPEVIGLNFCFGASRLNKGAPRDVPNGAKLHTSVKIRMDRDGYEPLPQLPPQYSFVD